ncbi:MAG: cobalt ABC transporter permease [Burkholderiales bacterium 66-5]|nr:MAG: cobalt ABC transporter permease [Burkholderiales bacterium 66-5]
MPVFIAAIGGVLINLVGTLAGRVLIALGIGVVTYSGMDASMGWAKDAAISALGSLPADALSLIGYLKVGVCVNIITSAMAARAVINGLSGDSFKRWVLK